MEKIFIVVMLITLASCEGSNVETTSSIHRVGILGTKLEVINIEGCEYFFAEYRGIPILAHKGNCTNPIHKSK